MKIPLLQQISEGLQKLYKAGKLKQRKKCCGKCAFRKNSMERCEPWGWMKMCDAWLNDDQVFACHEGIPGHPQHVEGEELHICAGWAAMQNAPPENWYDLAHLDDREPDSKFLEGYDDQNL